MSNVPTLPNMAESKSGPALLGPCSWAVYWVARIKPIRNLLASAKSSTKFSTGRLWASSTYRKKSWRLSGGISPRCMAASLNLATNWLVNSPLTTGPNLPLPILIKRIFPEFMILSKSKLVFSCPMIRRKVVSWMNLFIFEVMYMETFSRLKSSRVLSSSRRKFRIWLSKKLYCGEFISEYCGVERKAVRGLQIQDCATSLDDLKQLPSNRFEALQGDRKGSRDQGKCEFLSFQPSPGPWDRIR